ncbi:MAG: NUDIX hydrolase [bacterium]
MKNLLGRLLYKVGYAVYYLKWFITRPNTQGVQIILRNGDSILLIQHTYMHRGLWDFPGGGVKENENPIDAARRETEEELKLELSELKNVGVVNVYHSYHHDTVSVFVGHSDSKEIIFNRVEIKKTEWFPISNLPPNLSVLTKEVLDTYLKSLR